jgi:hypothetical protein
MLILHEIGAVREIHGLLGGIRARIPDGSKRRRTTQVTGNV